MSLSTVSQSAAVTTEELLTQLKWRYATKKFDATKKIDEETWKALEEALVLAPSSFGLQPWKFYVVKNSSLRAKLQGASWNQTQIVDASHLVVLARKKELKEADVEKFIKRTAEVRHAPEESLAGYKGILLGFIGKAKEGFDIGGWAAKQVYIALGTLLTSAALLGIDACPMEGIDPKAYDELLGLEKEGYQTQVVATLGYRAVDDKYADAAKVRYDQKEIIAHI